MVFPPSLSCFKLPLGNSLNALLNALPLGKVRRGRSPGRFVGSLVGGMLGGMVVAITPSAQALKTCEPPDAGNYLLLVRRENTNVELELYEALPESVAVTLCDYQGETVLRLGDFPSQAIAEAWQSYIQDELQRTAYIIEPSASAAAAGRTGYSPQALGDGYAVSVDYFSDLAIAQRLQRDLETSPGLVSYGQRPYLLVRHTDRLRQANELLEELSKDGFAVTVVNSRHAILLREAIALP